MFVLSKLNMYAFFLWIPFHKQHAALPWSDLCGLENFILYYFTSTCACWGISQFELFFYKLLKVLLTHYCFLFKFVIKVVSSFNVSCFCISLL